MIYGMSFTATIEPGKPLVWRPYTPVEPLWMDNLGDGWGWTIGELPHHPTPDEAEALMAKLKARSRPQDLAESEG